MNRVQAVELLKSEGWTQADVDRALGGLDFRTNPDELQVRRAISSFSGNELIKRQRLQAAQKGLVTKKVNEIDRINAEIRRLIAENEAFKAQAASVGQLAPQTDRTLEARLQKLSNENKQLASANEQLQKDNKALKNLLDAIRLKLAKDTKQLLQYKDSEIRRAVVKLFQSTLG